MTSLGISGYVWVILSCVNVSKSYFSRDSVFPSEEYPQTLPVNLQLCYLCYPYTDAKNVVAGLFG